MLGKVYFMFQLAGKSFGKHGVFGLISLLVIITLAALILKSPRKYSRLNMVLNITGICLLSISLIITALAMFLNNNDIRQRSSTLREETGIFQPDIYYIILDGYAGSYALQYIYNYDNRNFTDGLVNEGFFVVENGTSNYVTTTNSLASALNMEYINYLAQTAGLGVKGKSAVQNILQQSKAVIFLKDLGYSYIHFGSGLATTDHNKYADIEYHFDTDTKLMKMLAQNTVLGAFKSLYTKNDGSDIIYYTFSKLTQIPEMEGAKFVFAHIACPHPPYIFSKDGTKPQQSDLDVEGHYWVHKKPYLEQLEYINSLAIELVKQLISKSENPPIIILQADTGSGSLLFDDNGNGWDRPTEDSLKERHSILNAYYFPGQGKDILYDSITPVNTFRLIFNTYLNADFEILEDRNYFSHRERPLEFIDVTDMVTE